MNLLDEEFAAAAKAATCKILYDYGGGAALLTALNLGGPYAKGVALAGGIALWAGQEACEWDPDKPDPGGCQPNFCGCVEVEKAAGGQLKYKDADGVSRSTATNTGGSVYCQKLLSVDVSYNPAKSTVVRYESGGESRELKIRNPSGPAPHCYYLQSSTQSGACVNSCGGSEPPPQPQDYTYTTEEGCQLNVHWEAWGQLPDGTAAPIFRIEPAATTRQGGGIIGGCNFAPVIHYQGGGGNSGGGGGGTTIPYYPGDDDDGKPLWQDMLEKALPIALGNLAANAVGQLFEAKIEPAEFEFVAPCNKDDQGNQEFKIYQMPEQNYQSRVLTQQAVLMEMLQQHLNWKTPICVPHEGKGDYRTISFISLESSPDGKSRLRKRFRYRSQSGLELPDIVDHWKDFTFEAGDVCVQHRGSALGSPQVWAASADEGKRVIQHAGREAGIDPNQVGEWSIGGSDNPRYGMPGTMIVNTKGGYYWITARLGASGRPMVQVAS